MDCKVKSCTPTTTVVTFYVTFSPPPGQDASSVTALVGYRSDRVSIPGKGTGSCNGGSKDGKACSTGADCPGGQCTLPKSRVKNTPPGSIVGVNDLDYGVRVVLTRSESDRRRSHLLGGLRHLSGGRSGNGRGLRVHRRRLRHLFRPHRRLHVHRRHPIERERSLMTLRSSFLALAIALVGCRTGLGVLAAARLPTRSRCAATASSTRLSSATMAT